MTESNNKLENTKDKVVGKTKEAVGKATGNQETELKGKLQYQKGVINDKVDNVKEKVAEKINDTLDENEEDKVNY
ncbi:CsbD family protein [Clostridium tagluense]|uniref:CsbD family protein n=1 Tax=Clostridium tagluense TaxID=360422 RepID=UPI001CF40C70|nr:CsbD family protein [Clostridium tagluense]MCB2310326.1 CsbD family protein [Clostridium tagluense]MCB2315032.1 CsbD family protein [Clostridium tagluense]MCB2320026.1 CsbD family protein [Clostridium tagluense]MCB2324775.1 CsbD family protein [Clostridium tagluense]MCB2329771.1 CsbD family protein [Clostridium tagluense]